MIPRPILGKFRQFLAKIILNVGKSSKISAKSSNISAKSKFSRIFRMAKFQIEHWPGAPDLAYVDNKFHARLLAMTRLGLLPIEIETGRWHGIPRAERLCQMCGKCIGDTKHFLHGCERLTAERVKSLESKATYTEARGRALFLARRSAESRMPLEGTHERSAQAAG